MAEETTIEEVVTEPVTETVEVKEDEPKEVEEVKEEAKEPEETPEEKAEREELEKTKEGLAVLRAKATRKAMEASAKEKELEARAKELEEKEKALAEKTPSEQPKGYTFTRIEDKAPLYTVSDPDDPDEVASVEHINKGLQLTNTLADRLNEVGETQAGQIEFQGELYLAVAEWMLEKDYQAAKGAAQKEWGIDLTESQYREALAASKSVNLANPFFFRSLSKLSDEERCGILLESKLGLEIIKRLGDKVKDKPAPVVEEAPKPPATVEATSVNTSPSAETFDLKTEAGRTAARIAAMRRPATV